MSTDNYLGFEELAAAQAQPEVTVNAATARLAGAVAGQITINFASDANRTLVADDTAPELDEWPYATIRMTDTGVVLTTARDVIYPDVDTEYGGPSRMEFWFLNDTAEDLTIKRSGQTGVTVPAGQAAKVRHNGTDIEEVQTGGGGGSSYNPIQIAISEAGQAIVAATGVAYFRAPFAFKINDVRASLAVASATGGLEFDVKINGVSIFDTDLLTIDQGDTTSVGAGTPPNIDTAANSVGDDDEITFDITNDGDGAAETAIITLYIEAP